MNIRPTQYVREDGLTILRQDDDTWLLRHTYGPTWFYDNGTQKWRIAVSFKGNEWQKLGMPLAIAYDLLEKLPYPKRDDL